MKKIYNNVSPFALSIILCLSISLSASAQRGGEHSDNKSSGGGGSTPPPAAAPQRPAPQPQAQPQQQVQRSNPQPQQQPQQQPQVQRNSPQPQQQPQVQRNDGYNGQRNNAASGYNQPRGAEHQDRPVFTPANPSQRRYQYPGQRNNSYNPRAYGFNYSHGGSDYRSFPGLRYGRTYASPRPQGFYYRNRGYYSTYYTPQLGFSIGILPRGYYPFYYGPNQYFYSDGLYYRQEDNDNYTVVEPPVGAAIDRLPAKAQAIAINGNQYYELNGVYYQPITKDDGTLVYQIAGKDGELNTGDNANSISPDELPQVGDLVDNLPEGCKIVRLNGQRFYVSQEGYYFQDAIDTNGDKVFKIVGTPTDEPGN